VHDLNFPRVSLGFFPTPLIELANLGAALGGARILMKRDDQTGLALGGNKTRKLEYILGDALAQGCDTIITAGAEQSNHCRQTAAAAAKLKLECHLILGGAPAATCCSTGSSDAISTGPGIIARAKTSHNCSSNCSQPVNTPI
jgi:1-aminocyclopropane-1-carboxylate deaminase/D-cysteine desulfhydrase-like pyridoxal-dependent ACC family enzyme